MKPKIIIAFLLAIPVLASGSGRADSTMVDTSRPARFLELGAHVSVGASSILQNYASGIPGVSDLQVTPGCMAGLGFSARFVIRNFFAIGTGLDFMINNSRYAMSIVDNDKGLMSTVYVRNHFYSFDIPVFASFRFDVSRHVRWNVDLGWYMSFGAGGKMKAGGYTASTNSLGQPIVVDESYEWDYFREERPLVNGVRDVDYGPHLASGLKFYDRYMFQAVMHLSARNLAINHGVLDIYYRNINVAFQFGYCF